MLLRFLLELARANLILQQEIKVMAVVFFRESAPQGFYRRIICSLRNRFLNAWTYVFDLKAVDTGQDLFVSPRRTASTLIWNTCMHFVDNVDKTAKSLQVFILRVLGPLLAHLALQIFPINFFRLLTLNLLYLHFLLRLELLAPLYFTPIVLFHPQSIELRLAIWELCYWKAMSLGWGLVFKDTTLLLANLVRSSENCARSWFLLGLQRLAIWRRLMYLSGILTEQRTMQSLFWR